MQFVIQFDGTRPPRASASSHPKSSTIVLYFTLFQTSKSSVQSCESHESESIFCIRKSSMKTLHGFKVVTGGWWNGRSEHRMSSNKPYKLGKLSTCSVAPLQLLCSTSDRRIDHTVITHNSMIIFLFFHTKKFELFPPDNNAINLIVDLLRRTVAQSKWHSLPPPERMKQIILCVWHSFGHFDCLLFTLISNVLRWWWYRVSKCFKILTLLIIKLKHSPEICFELILVRRFELFKRFKV